MLARILVYHIPYVKSIFCTKSLQKFYNSKARNVCAKRSHAQMHPMPHFVLTQTLVIRSSSGPGPVLITFTFRFWSVDQLGFVCTNINISSICRWYQNKNKDM